MKQFPPALLVRAIWFRLRGRVHFPQRHIGDVVAGDREDFRVFRTMVVDPTGTRPSRPDAVLEVEFRFARFSPSVNKLLSRIPMPFIAVQPGFRSKTWMLGADSGTFRGVYEWDTTQDAQRYLTSFPMRLMKRRAVAETLTASVHPATRRTEEAAPRHEGLEPCGR